MPAVLMPDELMHYGVLGMKWGVRKDRSKGSKRAEAKAKPKKRAWNQDAMDLENRNKARANRQLKLVPKASDKARSHIDSHPEIFGKVSPERFDHAVSRVKKLITEMTDDEELWDSTDNIVDEICDQVQWLKQYGGPNAWR